MSGAAPILAVLPEYPSISEVLGFQLNGLIVVFMALGSIWLLVELMGAYFRSRAAVAPVPAPTSAAIAVGNAETGLPATTVAVIAAAVHVALGARPHRISAISPAANATDWAREGRREIFSSHRIR